LKLVQFDSTSHPQYRNPSPYSRSPKKSLCLYLSASPVEKRGSQLNVAFRNFESNGGFSILAESGEVGVRNLESFELEPL